MRRHNFCLELSQAASFCDSTTHDHTATNQQNFWCRNRSIKSIIRNHPDIRYKTPLPPSQLVPEPKFNYMKPAKTQPIYIVVDASDHMGAQYQTVFDTIKDQLDKIFLPSLANAPESIVSILTMGGSAVNSGSSLGGYLSTVASPIAVCTKLYVGIKRDGDHFLFFFINSNFRLVAATSIDCKKL